MERSLVLLISDKPYPKDWGYIFHSLKLIHMNIYPFTQVNSYEHISTYCFSITVFPQWFQTFPRISAMKIIVHNSHHGYNPTKVDVRLLNPKFKFKRYWAWICLPGILKLDIHNSINDSDLGFNCIKDSYLEHHCIKESCPRFSCIKDSDPVYHCMKDSDK